MIEILMRKGFMSEKEPAYVSQLRRKSPYGEVIAFYCDSEYNHVSFRTIMNGFVSSERFNKDNFRMGFLHEAVRELDEALLERDVRIRCLVLVWISPEGDKLICKVGDFINVYELFYGWEQYEAQNILFFSSRASNDLFLGSGVCLPLEAFIAKGNFIYLMSDHTVSHIDKSSESYSPSSYFVNIHDDTLPESRHKSLDLNDYAEFLDKGRLDKVVESINHDYFNKKQSAYSQFFAILD